VKTERPNTTTKTRFTLIPQSLILPTHHTIHSPHISYHYEDNAHEYGNNGNHGNDEYDKYLDRAESIYSDSDPTSSELDNNECQPDDNSNGTGGDWEMEYKGEVEVNEQEALEYETMEEVSTDQGKYESAVLKYEHTGSDYGVDKPQQPGYNNNETRQLKELERVSVRWEHEPRGLEYEVYEPQEHDDEEAGEHTPHPPFPLHTHPQPRRYPVKSTMSRDHVETRHAPSLSPLFLPIHTIVYHYPT
jgi:hypothetical protein